MLAVLRQLAAVPGQLYKLAQSCVASESISAERQWRRKMPNGNLCKLNFTLFLGTDLAKVRMKTDDGFYSRAEDEHGREVVSSMVHFLGE